jgi:glycosyltransferase involved in cell wall biosynthesis
MRVVVVHNRYRSGPASGENRVVELEVDLLRRAGHEVAAWLSDYAPGVGRAKSAMEAVWSRRAVAELERVMEEIRPDVVHFHNLFPTLSPAVLRYAARRAAVVLTLHNYRYLCPAATLFRAGQQCELCVGRMPWPAVRHGCYRGSVAASLALATSLALHRACASFRSVDLFLAVSHALRRAYVAAGWDGNRIEVRYNWAPAGPVRRGAGEGFVTVARLAPEKGVLDLARHWPPSLPPLVVVGDGPDRAAIEALGRPNVRLTGLLQPPRVQRLVRSSRALVVPSRWSDPAPQATLEALAAGVPVIASRVGGIPELVEDGVSGLLVDPSCPGAFAKAAESLLDDAVSLRLGAAALAAWRERFAPARGLSTLEAAYERAARTRLLRLAAKGGPAGCGGR